MLRILRGIALPIACCLSLAFLWGCGQEEPVVEEKVVVPYALERAQQWVGETLSQMGPEQRAAQLLMIEAPADTVGEEWRQFRQWVRSYGVGGVVFRRGNRELQRVVSDSVKRWAPLPVWMALEMGPEWRRDRGLGSWEQLAALNNDSLVASWGSVLGKECRYLGADIAFMPLGKVGPADASDAEGMGGDPERVLRLSRVLLTGLQEEGVLPCASLHLGAVPNRPLGELLERELYPLQQLLADSLAGLQLSVERIEALDSQAIALSSFVQSKLLRDQMGYPGLLFSPPGVGEGLGAARELQALHAGTDMLVAPDSVGGILVEILQEVVDQPLGRAFLEEKTRRLLMEKALAGMDTSWNRAREGEPLALGQLAAADRRVSRAAFVLLRNEKDLLPMTTHPQKDLAVLAVGEEPSRGLRNSIKLYREADFFGLPANATVAQADQTFAGLKKYDRVVVALQAEDLSDFPELRRRLQALDGETGLVVAHWGGARDLGLLDSLSTVVHATDNRSQTRELFGQWLFGAAPSWGRLPYAGGAAFAVGEGLDQDRRYRLAYGTPEEAGANPELLQRVDSVIYAAIRMGVFPGCQVLAARKGQVFWHKSYGHHDYERLQRVRQDDVYDIASLTKIAATTLVSMWSWEKDSLQLTEPLKSYLPELDDDSVSIRDITPEQLLIHRAGLPPGLPIFQYISYADSSDSLFSLFFRHQADSGYSIEVAENLYFRDDLHDSLWSQVKRVVLDPQRRYVYSDLSMFLLKMVLESRHETSLEKLANQYFYRPLGLRTMCFHPKKHLDKDRIVPTEHDRWWRRQVLKGYVHDPTTALYGGIGGQAGLFSNAEDLAVIFQMLLDGGTYGRHRFLSPKTVARFTSRHPESHRGLGFDMQAPLPRPDRGMVCGFASPTTYGHTGFTGTCAWADPENEVVFVMLTNRVHPSSNNKKINILRVRQTVQQIVYEALGLVPEKEENPTYLVEEQVDSLPKADRDSSGCMEC